MIASPADGARTGEADLGVHVRTVHVDLSAAFVDDAAAEFFTGFTQIIILFFRNALDDARLPGILIGRPAPAKRRAGSITGAERDATDPSRLWAFRAMARRKARQRNVVKGR